MAEQQYGFDLGTPDRVDKPLFDSDEIRADALAIIAEARGCTRDGPWDAAELKYRRIMFPHLVSWVTDEAERDQLRFAFTREIERIEALLAA
ncbi:hypothetical protein [Sphingomonas sp.]|uniref:hypothetical protein n=1 Tax=Sphingomonas sp. TaxID=28214 RepID=UPI0035BC2C84